MKLQMMDDGQKTFQIPLWKRMTLITAILFSGGSLAVLPPSQAVFAHESKPAVHHHHDAKKEEHKTRVIVLKPVDVLIQCKAGNGGKGGSATKKSNGANGAPGGSCNVNIPIKIGVTVRPNMQVKEPRKH